jgi:hypothetical protein
MGSQDVEGTRGYPPASTCTFQSSRSPGILDHHLHNTILGINAEFSVTMNPSYLNRHITERDWNPLHSLTPKAWSGGNAIPQPTPHPEV